jgi:hypothetical protein
MDRAMSLPTGGELSGSGVVALEGSGVMLGSESGWNTSRYVARASGGFSTAITAKNSTTSGRYCTEVTTVCQQIP